MIRIMEVDDDRVSITSLLWLFLLEFGFLMGMSLEPGFLDFDNLPDTNFSCVGKVIGGYYADLETNCQMFHVCTIGQLDEPMDIRFLCLNGTVFDQETRVCERIDEVDCSKSEQFYSLNLELYGNTQPPILEEDLPVEIKRSSTSTTTTTTTTQRPSHPKSTSQPYYTTSAPPTTTRPATKVITSHHFPVVSSPDIRFNPEEINISLNPGAPPDITRSQVPISFQQQSYTNSEKNTRVTVTTHTTIYKNDKPHRVPLLPTPNPPRQILVEHENLENPAVAQTTQTPKSVVSYGLTHSQGSQAATPTEINYGFTYQQTEETLDFNTEVPPHPYQYQINIANLRPPTAQGHPYHSIYQTTSKRTHKINFPVPTTYRNHPAYTSIRTSSSEHFDSQRTEKPPRLQLPLPLLPTLPPLTFSSPAPFSLGRHIETKRYTNDHHQSPPRIIISASASVSDNSGRRLNYSLGTIGASHLLGPSPSSYDDYKEDDVGLDPFYHDVPKIKSLRHKRDVLREEDVIKNEQEAADLLRFLFNWYSKREKMRKISIPVASEDITEINEELAPIIETSTGTEEDYPILDKVNTEHITQPNVEGELESISIKREIQSNTKNSTDYELADLAKKLEVLNETYQLKSNLESSKEELHELVKENKSSEVVELIHPNDNKTLSGETHDLHKNDDHVSVSTVKTPAKKQKHGRNHRRRTGKSRTTPRRKKPKGRRKTNHGRPSNSTHVQEGSGDDPNLNKSHQVSELHSKSSRNNSSRSGRARASHRKTNTVVENLEMPKPELQFFDDVTKDQKNVEEVTAQHTKNLEKGEIEKSASAAVPVTDRASIDGDPSTVGNKSELFKEVKDENIQQKNLSKIYDLLGEPEPVNFLPQRDPKIPENDAEQVETHESKQFEDVIATHENLELLQPENNSSEITTTGNPTSKNSTTGNPTSENSTTGNPTSEHSTTGNPTSEHSTTGNPTTEYSTTGNPTTENSTTGNPTPDNSSTENSTPQNSATENSTPQNSATENSTPQNSTTENSTLENSSTEIASSKTDKLKNLKDEEHSTEFIYETTEKPLQDNGEFNITTNYPEYVPTTLQPNHNHENLEAQPSSYRNEENAHEFSSVDEENNESRRDPHNDDVLSVVNKEVDKISKNDETQKLNHPSQYEEYENDSEPPGYVEDFKEQSDIEQNMHRTDKTLEDQDLDEATLHIDLLKSENNPERFNDENDFTEHSLEPLHEEDRHGIDYEIDRTTQNLGIDTTTPQLELQENEEHVEEEKSHDINENIALAPRHKNKQLPLSKIHNLNRDDIELNKNQEKSDTSQEHEENENQTKKRGRNNFQIASRRTYEAASDEASSRGPKLSAISLYKNRAEEQKRRNNYIRNRKFIANPITPSKNIESSEITKSRHKEDHESQLHDKNNPKKENPIIPDYVDDNYEPLTYQEPSEEKEFEHVITTTHQDQDLDENSVTDKLLRLNSLEHSTDFNEISDYHGHTSVKPNEDEGNVLVQNTTDDKDETINHEKINANQEEEEVEEVEEIEILTTPTIHDQPDQDIMGSTEVSYELLTEATTALGFSEHLTTEAYLKYVEEQTTEQPTTQLTTQTVEITTLPSTTPEIGDAIHNYETTKEPLTTTTTAAETTTHTSLPSEYPQTTNLNTESSLDLLKSIFTTDYPTEETTMNLETTQAISVSPSSSTDSSRSVSSLTEPEERIDLTTASSETTTTNKYQHLRTRVPWYKRQNNAKRIEHAKHRFSTNNRRAGLRERTKVENKITRVLNNLNRSNSNSHISADELLVDRHNNVNNNNTAKLSDINPIVNYNTTMNNINNNSNSSNNSLEVKHDLEETKIPPPIQLTTVKTLELIETTVIPEEPQTTTPTEIGSANSGENRAEIPVTDAPLLKSANPTKAKYTKIVFTTTPLSKLVRVELRKDMHGRRYSFNCFNKKVHQFYSDARDCRLFHYCTLGYTKNQMVDMKFVCDLGTYFDEEKLICTKAKPARCL